MKITPIFDPAQEALREAGLLRKSGAGDKNQLREILENSDLSLERVIQQLSNTVHESSDEAIKLRGIDTALKLHRVMDDPEANKIPQVTIVIQNNGSGSTSPVGTIPSIFLPREITPQEVIEI